MFAPQKKGQIYQPEAGYNKYACQYDKSLKFLDSFEQGYFQWLNRDLTGKKVLDAGCGTGRNTVRLAQLGAQITAVDISEEMLKKVKAKVPGIKTVQADIEHLPFKDEEFDIVFCQMVLVHLKDPRLALDQFYRLCKNGGELYLTVLHQRDPALLKVGKEKFKIKSYYHSADKIREILNQLCWQIIEERPVIEKEKRISTIFHCKK